LLSADVRVADVLALGAPGLLTVVALMLLVRPLTVAISTFRTGLSFKEKAFLSWLAPRGIVAAAVASLFAVQLAEKNVPGGVEMKALVFLVIAITVTLQGLSGGVVARFLGLKRPHDLGYAILGANPLARALARVLSTHGEPVVLIDSDMDAC
jgi:NhaP-type Na+/H+ or K+/H+ antiporter